MGEQTDRKLYFSVNGVDYTELIGIPDVTCDCGAIERGFNGGEMTISFKLPQVLRCKSRKRFVKLLMSIGVPRNVASTLRATPGETYQQMWRRVFFFVRLM